METDSGPCGTISSSKSVYLYPSEAINNHLVFHFCSRTGCNYLDAFLRAA